MGGARRQIGVFMLALSSMHLIGMQPPPLQFRRAPVSRPLALTPLSVLPATPCRFVMHLVGSGSLALLGVPPRLQSSVQV